MDVKTFLLPDLGEGLQEAEIVSWKVSVGDSIVMDQLLMEVKTQKAIVEIPSPYTGTVKALHGKVGDVLGVGVLLVEFEVAESSDCDVSAPEKKMEPAYLPTPELEPKKVAEGGSTHGILAMPMVRKRACELGVDLSKVAGTGPNGSITLADIEPTTQLQTMILGETRKEYEAPLPGVRKLMARTMERAHREVVATTVFDRAQLPYESTTSDITSRLIYAVIAGCRASPSLNAWYNSERQTVTRHVSIDLGLAVDTKHGLFVPVLERVDTLLYFEMREALVGVKKAVLGGKALSSVTPTITLSNVGAVGGEYATAIVVPPQVAIVVAGRIRDSVCVMEGEVRRCKILPLSLTFDHRVVTGVEATRFLVAMIESLEKKDNF
ncbi:MAG TPA: dihydrolipoamide acetyltransferase family protein [Candidatus Paceibacterota bacterium]